jgi:DNA gyrase subunit A
MMSDFAKEIMPVSIESELKQSYLSYAMSVIVGRALPDVRDGLKPVHRRVLFAMHELSNDYDKPYKKSARVVGDVIGKYHPHGDVAVYDAIVRMAQSFSMRYLLVDGQGNFGSVDGDSPAAMRYTEVRMSRLASYLLEDLEKETVNFVLNYDGSEKAPEVLPARVPNLLINGSSGIAVGMATNIPPHNLTEVVNGCIALIEQPETTIDDLIKLIPGPDFPTKGTIYGREGIYSAYRTGRGRIYLRARTELETDEDNGKESIIIKELPYQVNKAKLVEKIVELAKEKRIEGITAVRDESDKDGMRVVVELRRGEQHEITLNNLFSLTPMQSVFGINMVALVDGRPRLLNLKQVLEAFLQHRREVVTRRSLYELRRARERAHILEGLSVALANIDRMIQVIKTSPTPAEAKTRLLDEQWNADLVRQLLSKEIGHLVKPDDLPADVGLIDGHYKLSAAQADAILELRLQRLTALEQDKIHNEYKELLAAIEDLLDILARPVRLMQVIKDELLEVVKQFGDARGTVIEEAQGEFLMEDLISDEPMVLTLSHEGYVKSQPLTMYQAQRRGGKGKAATQVKDEDFVEQLVVATKHDTLLCFSSSGKVYWLRGYQFPEASRTAKGRPIINLLPLSPEERIQAMLPIRTYDEDRNVIMATSHGVVKKTALPEFSRPRTSGIIAIDLDEGDRLVGVSITDGVQDVMLFSNGGKGVRFSEKQVRSMGRTARGVRGIRLGTEQKVISALVVLADRDILTVTENGYGKRTKTDEYRTIGRGGQGVLAIPTNERNGQVVSAVQVMPDDEIMIITDRGTLVRTRVAEISRVGRQAQGVRLINLSQGEKVVCVERIEELADDGTDVDSAIVTDAGTLPGPIVLDLNTGDEPDLE